MLMYSDEFRANHRRPRIWLSDYDSQTTSYLGLYGLIGQTRQFNIIENITGRNKILPEP